MPVTVGFRRRNRDRLSPVPAVSPFHGRDPDRLLAGRRGEGGSLLGDLGRQIHHVQGCRVRSPRCRCPRATFTHRRARRSLEGIASGSTSSARDGLSAVDVRPGPGQAAAVVVCSLGVRFHDGDCADDAVLLCGSDLFFGDGSMAGFVVGYQPGEVVPLDLALNGGFDVGETPRLPTRARTASMVPVWMPRKV
jgi:hypothetical protein